MAKFTDLPLELIVSIARYADTMGDKLSLMLTSKKCVSPLIQELLYPIAASYPAEKWCHLAAGTMFSNNLLAFKQLIAHSSALLESIKSSTGKSIFYLEYRDERLSDIHAKYAKWGHDMSENCLEARLAGILCFLFHALSNIREMIILAIDTGMTLEEHNEYFHPDAEYGSWNMTHYTNCFFRECPLATTQDEVATLKLLKLFREKDELWTESRSFIQNLKQLMRYAVERDYVTFVRTVFWEYEEEFRDFFDIDTDEEEEEGEEGEEEEEEEEEDAFDIFNERPRPRGTSRTPHMLYLAATYDSPDVVEFILSLQPRDASSVQWCFEAAAEKSSNRCLDTLLQHGAIYTSQSMHTRAGQCRIAPNEELSYHFEQALLAWQPLSPEQRRDAINIAAKTIIFARVLLQTLPDIFDGELPDGMNILDAIYYVGLERLTSHHAWIVYCREDAINLLLEKAGSRVTDSKPPKWLTIQHAVYRGHTMPVRMCLKRAYDAAEEGEKKEFPMNLLLKRKCGGLFSGDNAPGCIRVLVQEGCDPGWRDKDGDNAILAACRDPRYRVLEELSAIPSVDFNINVEKYSGGYRVIEDQDERGHYRPRDTAVGLIVANLLRGHAESLDLEIVLKAGAIVPDRTTGGSLLHELVCGQRDPYLRATFPENPILGAAHIADARPELAHEVVCCQRPCLGGNLINCVVTTVTSLYRRHSKFLLLAGGTLLQVRDLCYSKPLNVKEGHWTVLASEKLLQSLAKCVFHHKIDCSVRDCNGNTPLDVIRSALRYHHFDYDWDLLQARLEANPREESPIAGRDIMSAWMLEEEERKSQFLDMSDITDCVSALWPEGS